MRPAQAAEQWIEQAIREERPQAHPDAIATVGAALHQTATDYDVPIEELLAWIHVETAGLEPEDWQRSWLTHCRQYAALRKRLCNPNL